MLYLANRCNLAVRFWVHYCYGIVPSAKESSANFDWKQAIRFHSWRVSWFRTIAQPVHLLISVYSGFQSMSISEVFGEFRCGKTQLSHTMSVIAQLPREMGGADGKVAYIDTEGTFRPERIAQIAERFGVDPESAQENIAYARALNSEHQLELLNTLTREFAGGEYRLLVIDSIMNCFRVDYCGRGELADRQQKLNQFLMKLAHMAEGKRKKYPSIDFEG